MKKRTAVILFVVLILSACNSFEKLNNNSYQIQASDSNNGIDEPLAEIDHVDKIESSIDNDIYNIFPCDQDFVWHYEGPNDSERISILDKVAKKDEHYILTIKSCREDLTGEEELENRISYSTIEITDSQIIYNDSVILRTPLIHGNKWITDYKIKPSGEMHTATVEIVEISDNTIKTKTLVSSDSNDIVETYEEVTIYELGVGIISQRYNIVGMGGYTRGLELKQTYDQPEIPDKWYLFPYEIKFEKSNS